MQKHQQWLADRQYEHHLSCLKKIKSRKNHTGNLSKRHQFHSNSKQTPHQSVQKENRISNLHFNQQSKLNSQKVIQEINCKTQQSRDHQQQVQNYEQNFKSNEQPQFIRQKYDCFSSRNPFTISENFLQKNKKSSNFGSQSRDLTNISLKQQELLWNNFLLGKRILETAPVISKRKLDLQFQKHKQLLKSRTTKKIQGNSNFRLRKLQQHNDKIDKIQDDQRIQNNLHRQYIINLVIKSVEIYKYKFSSFQNIIVVMKHDKLETQNGPVQKKIKQVSECIPSSMLVSYNFFFNFKKKLFDENIPVIVQIKNVKSLNVLSIGTFSFQFHQEKQIVLKQANLFNFGKLIGTVKFSAHFGRKNQFLSKTQ